MLNLSAFSLEWPDVRFFFFLMKVLLFLKSPLVRMLFIFYFGGTEV
jgi:hypothetical protein